MVHFLGNLMQCFREEVKYFRGLLDNDHFIVKNKNEQAFNECGDSDL